MRSIGSSKRLSGFFSVEAERFAVMGVATVVGRSGLKVSGLACAWALTLQACETS